jgi:MFS family permease
MLTLCLSHSRRDLSCQSAVWLSTAAFIYNPLGAAIADKVGRRKAMLLGIGMCIVNISILTARELSTENLPFASK